MINKLRVFIDLEPDAAPEPIGAVHPDCRNQLPDADDGYPFIVDGASDDFEQKLANDQHCQVCGWK